MLAIHTLSETSPNIRVYSKILYGHRLLIRISVRFDIHARFINRKYCNNRQLLTLPITKRLIASLLPILISKDEGGQTVRVDEADRMGLSAIIFSYKIK